MRISTGDFNERPDLECFRLGACRQAKASLRRCLRRDIWPNGMVSFNPRAREEALPLG